MLTDTEYPIGCALLRVLVVICADRCASHLPDDMAFGVAWFYSDRYVGSVSCYVSVIEILAFQECRQALDRGVEACRGMYNNYRFSRPLVAKHGLVEKFTDFWMG